MQILIVVSFPALFGEIISAVLITLVMRVISVLFTKKSIDTGE